MGCSSSKSTATADTLGPPPPVAAPTGGVAGGTKRGTPQPASTTPQPAGVGGGKKTPPAGGEPAAAQAALRIGVGGNTRLSARELASGVSPVATPGGTLKPRVDPRALADLPPAAVLAAVLNDAGYFANLLNLLLRKAHTTTKPSEAGVSSTGAAEGDIVKALDNPVTRAAFQKLVDTIALSTEERFCHGDTVLEIACAAGAADVVDLLLRASPHLVNHVKAQTGNTLLHFTAIGPRNVSAAFEVIRSHLLHDLDMLNAVQQCNASTQNGQGAGGGPALLAAAAPAGGSASAPDQEGSGIMVTRASSSFISVGGIAGTSGSASCLTSSKRKGTGYQYLLNLALLQEHAPTPDSAPGNEGVTTGGASSQAASTNGALTAAAPLAAAPASASPPAINGAAAPSAVLPAGGARRRSMEDLSGLGVRVSAHGVPISHGAPGAGAHGHAHGHAERRTNDLAALAAHNRMRMAQGSAVASAPVGMNVDGSPATCDAGQPRVGVGVGMLTVPSGVDLSSLMQQQEGSDGHKTTAATDGGMDGAASPDYASEEVAAYDGALSMDDASGVAPAAAKDMPSDGGLAAVITTTSDSVSAPTMDAPPAAATAPSAAAPVPAPMPVAPPVTNCMFADVSMTDLAVRFPVRSIERTVQVLLTYANARCKKNLFGKVPRDIALAYANQIIPEATLSTASSGAGSGLLADGKLFERLMHPISVDWDVVAELLFDPTGMPRVTRMAAK